MALTFSGERKLQFFRGDWDGGPVVGIVDITIGTYATGGLAIAADDIDSSFHEILGLMPIGVTDGVDGAWHCIWDAENGKLLVVDPADGLELGVEDPGTTFRCLFICQ